MPPEVGDRLYGTLGRAGGTPTLGRGYGSQAGTLRRTPGQETNYNSVKIVYRNGEKTMELNCMMEPPPCPQLNITSNPLGYDM